MKARFAKLSRTLTTTEPQVWSLATGYADIGAARFLCRRPAIYSGPTPPNNSARNNLFEMKNIWRAIYCIYNRFHFVSLSNTILSPIHSRVKVLCLLDFMLHRNYDISLFVAFFDILVCIGYFFQRIASINDGS